MVIFGFVYFIGPTMGYLIGFLIATYLAGTFKYKNCLDKNIFSYLTIMEVAINVMTNFIKLVIAVSFIYIFGLLWLGFIIGWDKPIFELGAQPFLLAELFKILIATFGISQIKKIRKLI